jgi:hypothetical protein
VRLNTDAPGAAGSNVPRICCAGDAVYVVWSDQRAGPSEIRFNRSLDAGTTWLTDDVRLDRDDPGPASSFEPRICCDGSRVYVVWRDLRNGLPDVYFNVSTDGGTTWLAQDVRIDTDGAGAADSAPPRIGCDGTSVYVAWQDHRSGAGDIRFNRSLDGGASWLEDDAWHDERDGEPDIRLNRSLDAGANWLGSDRRLDTDGPGAAASRFVSLACDADAVYAVWEDSRHGRPDVRFNRSTDGGATWLLFDVRLDTDPPGTASSCLLAGRP